MKRKLTVILSGCILLPFYLLPQQLAPLESYKYLTRPFLDSLRIYGVDTRAGKKEFILESVFPADDMIPAVFMDYTSKGTMLNTFVPHNDNLSGLISTAIPLFGEGQLVLVYSFATQESKYLLDMNYSFTSRIETTGDQNPMIRQRLQLKLKDDISVYDIRYGMLDIGIALPGVDPKDPESGDFAGWRHLWFNNENGLLVRYMYRDMDGVYSIMNFEDGSDFKKPEFEKGRTGMWEFTMRNMQYPEEALREGQEGTVLVQVYITEKGEVEDAEIFLGSNRYLNDEALRLARLSSGRWIPGCRNGMPEKGEAVFQVTFSQEQLLLAEDYLAQQDRDENLLKLIDEFAAGDYDDYDPFEVWWSDWDSEKIYRYVIIYFILGFIFFFILILVIVKGKKKRKKRDARLLYTVVQKNPLLINDKQMFVAGESEERVKQALKRMPGAANPHEPLSLVIETVGEHLVRITGSDFCDVRLFFKTLEFFNHPMIGDWKGRCIGWGTVPILGEFEKDNETLYAMVEHPGGYNKLIVTARDNRCWKISVNIYNCDPIRNPKSYRDSPV